jgi:hypothetical protein
MEYDDDTLVIEDDVLHATEVTLDDLEAFIKSLTAPPAKQLSPQEKVEVRRKVEDILYEKNYQRRYGDPWEIN